MAVTPVVIVAGVVLLLLVLAGVGVGIWLIVRKKKNDDRKKKITTAAVTTQAAAATEPVTTTQPATTTQAATTEPVTTEPVTTEPPKTTKPPRTTKPPKPSKKTTKPSKPPRTTKPPRSTTKPPQPVENDGPHAPVIVPAPVLAAGQALPLPKLVLGEAPWHIRAIRNKELISFDEDGTMRYRYYAQKVGHQSGPSIFANPLQMFPADAATLSFSVFLPADYDFVRAGKMLGLAIGTKPGAHASGGKWLPDGGSVRFMWRNPDGPRSQIVGYLYLGIAGGATAAIEQQGPDAQRLTDMESDPRTGYNIWYKKVPSGMYVYKNQWNAMSMTVRLNTPGRADGFLKMTVNGVSREVNDLMYRQAADVRITETFLTSIFGGSDIPKFALTKETYSKFKDFRLAA